MNKPKDQYGVYKNVSEVILKNLGKPSVTTLRPPRESIAELNQNFSNALKEQISYIRQKLNDIHTADDLVKIWRDSCVSMDALATRYAILKKVIPTKTPLNPKNAFGRVLREGSLNGGAAYNINDPFRDFGDDIEAIFDSLPGQEITVASNHHKPDYIRVVDTVFGGDGFETFFDEDAERSALASTVLIRHLCEINSTSSLDALTEVFSMHSAADNIVRGNVWKQFPLLGYIDEGIHTDDDLYYSPVYKLNIQNRIFVDTFANKITALLNEAQPDSDLTNYYACAAMRDALLSLTIQSFFGLSDSYRVFSAISYYIDLFSNRREPITDDDLNDCKISPSPGMVLSRTDMSGTTYQLNVAGLRSFVSALSELNLLQMPAVSVIVDKINSAVTA